MIRHLPAAARVAAPWKNGGGSTADVLVQPAGAGLEDFGWRLSVATIAGSGPFSDFKGVDRSLSLLSQEPLRLLVDEVCFQLDRQNPTLRFSGEARVRAEAAGAPHTVLNVMSRRDCFAHALGRHTFSGPQKIELDGAVHILFIQSGECRTLDSGLALLQHDAIFIQDEAAILLHADAPASLIAVAIKPA
ncbi:HutD family protein [Undibacterium sp.]|uniref:HutD/Ves family protein n=1 Tax=Undibacterium sp. TaxID=1914977 RepID=UPI002C9EA54A|nr:HutD family protein [Undibacterium sp.]HTD03474.1 HutD family protein [Undibacterium sp.]